MGGLKLFDDTAETEASRELFEQSPFLRAGVIAITALTVIYLGCVLARADVATPVGLTWAVLATIVGAYLWRAGLRKTALNRFCIAGVVGLLSLSMYFYP